ncbi:MAG: glucose-6-phosphate isomerase [Eubacteriales bacterium]|nr:glucose-6-phosphate isomerase [Eubacteriales bacterium]
MNGLKIDYSKAEKFINQEDFKAYGDLVNGAHKMLHNKTGAGSDFLGWVDLPNNYDKDEFNRVLETAEEIKSNSDVMVVIGIGGSYLGARAAVEALNHSFYNGLEHKKRGCPKVIFAGQNISSAYLNDLTDLLDNKDISLNVISKSGTTTEPAIAFRFFKEYMEKRYGRKQAVKRIHITTDKSKGALRGLADAEGYNSFIIPDDVGGRYSVLTPVGLLPIAVTAADIKKMMQGAADAASQYMNDNFRDNDCYMYAALRNYFCNNGKLIEIMACYEPSMHCFIEWWKQLYGESEGKDGKGLFPAGVDLTTDLHSIGQYIQDGQRILFETVMNIEKSRSDIFVRKQDDDSDQLNYLAGKSLHDINTRAMEGTVLAHTDGRVPNLVLNIPEMTSYYFGQLVYFFEKACAISGYILGVNPFNQPGVEAYKKNMFALLGKPGYEDLKAELEARI